MPVSIVVPQMGESVVEGTISKWLKKEGENVAKDEPLVEIMTDKINVEVPSPKAGVLAKILSPVNSVVPIGQEIAILTEPGEVLSEGDGRGKATQAPVALSPERSMSFVAAEKVAAAVKEEAEELRLSPAVRRLVKEHKVDVTKIKGTGAGGRITRDDVLTYVEKQKTGIPSAVPAIEIPAFKEPGALEEVVPLSTVRRLIAEHMVKSKATAPHVTTWDEVEMDKLVPIREKLKAYVQETYKLPFTYLPFLIKASVKALKEYPLVNATLDLEGGKVILKKYYNIGTAVAREEGLIVPVLKNADSKTLLQIAQEIKVLSDKAREDRLSLDDIQGGTFTITNAGMYGALASTPIINQPQVAILGVHKIEQRSVVKDNQLAIGWRMTLCLSFDHRLIDGHLAVQFLHRIKYYLENLEEWYLNVV